jgi:uncharacterized Zn finger protein (UPF0148 family)
MFLTASLLICLYPNLNCLIITHLYVMCCIAEWDPWGIPDDHEIEMVENDAPIPKHVPQHRPPRLPKEFQDTLDALMADPSKMEKIEELVAKTRKDGAAGTSNEEPKKP